MKMIVYLHRLALGRPSSGAASATTTTTLPTKEHGEQIVRTTSSTAPYRKKVKKVKNFR